MKAWCVCPKCDSLDCNEYLSPERVFRTLDEVQEYFGVFNEEYGTFTDYHKTKDGGYIFDICMPDVKNDEGKCMIAYQYLVKCFEY